MSEDQQQFAARGRSNSLMLRPPPYDASAAVAEPELSGLCCSVSHSLGHERPAPQSGPTDESPRLPGLSPRRSWFSKRKGSESDGGGSPTSSGNTTPRSGSSLSSPRSSGGSDSEYSEEEVRRGRKKERERQTRKYSPDVLSCEKWLRKVRIAADEVALDEKPIGEGATAVVFRGSFRGMDVAVKVAKGPEFLSPDEKVDLFREIHTHCKCRDPHIVYDRRPPLPLPRL
eukprot:m51a1_g3809 putative serine-threonine protein (229) ;mRNA; f:252919-254187